MHPTSPKAQGKPLHERETGFSLPAVVSDPTMQTPPPTVPQDRPLTDEELLLNSTLYREFVAEREEILKHKWIESEKAGYDIGFDRALTDWCARHRNDWRRARSLANRRF